MPPSVIGPLTEIRKADQKFKLNTYILPGPSRGGKAGGVALDPVIL